MRNRSAEAERARLVPHAAGVVLEIGIGSALNVRHYPPAVRALLGVDPSAELWRIGRHRLARASFPVWYVTASAEALPVGDECIDTVVMTWTLCSIPDARRALAEMRRVLRPDGRLIFVEHGRAPDPSVRRWQDRLNPFWARIAGGCQLNRPIDSLLEAEGFRPITLDRGYSEGLRPMSYLYKGIAAKG
jgi:ubiquinone/menaquinone biosynthesis C-methylase UbiE